jgi:diguanylate cyclase (GGDEF)-like protein
VREPNAVVFAPRKVELPRAIGDWLASLRLKTVDVATADALMALALRGRPRVVAFDARDKSALSWEALGRLKTDSYTGVVPCVALVGESLDDFKAAFAAGADEVVRYADLDHFKEFNDRYSYFDGDGVIRILAKILHDVVKGMAGEEGFVGHIGGDDFIFVIPVDAVTGICSEILEVFDLLIPFQYSEQDRRAGYFFGKDRRGQLHRVPIMTLSIGVVTNERRTFTHAAQVSELATEMKSYAKTQPGSKFSIDRRTGTDAAEPFVARAGAVSED